MESTIMNNIQYNIAKGQHIPVVGPLVVAPCQLVVSTAQLIVGLAKIIFFGTISLTAGVMGLKFISRPCFWQAANGFKDLLAAPCFAVFSLANMLTLGVVASVIHEKSSIQTHSYSY